MVFVTKIQARIKIDRGVFGGKMRRNRIPHVPQGTSQGLDGRQVQGHLLFDKKPICMCLSAFLSGKHPQLSANKQSLLPTTNEYIKF